MERRGRRPSERRRLPRRQSLSTEASQMCHAIGIAARIADEIRLPAVIRRRAALTARASAPEACTETLARLSPRDELHLPAVGLCDTTRDLGVPSLFDAETFVGGRLRPELARLRHASRLVSHSAIVPSDPRLPWRASWDHPLIADCPVLVSAYTASRTRVGLGRTSRASVAGHGDRPQVPGQAEAAK